MPARRHNINGWEGWIHKQGSVVPSWKKRYMVLSGRDVAYYDRDVKDAKAKEKGFFKLVAVYVNNDIENGLILTDDTGKSMNIYTKTRDEFTICYRAMKHAVDQANVKITPRAPQQPAPPSVQHSGWLEKEGDLVPTWKRRYFYLFDTNLKYFDKPQGGVQKGGGRVIDVNLSDRQYGLSIQLDNGRVLKVVADSEVDAQAWYNAVNQALGRPIHEFAARRMSRPPSFRSQAVASPHTGRPMLRSESLSSRQQPADPVSHAGWLTKHNEVSNTWKRRFFMLTDRSLKYYDKPLGGLQKGGGYLTNITIVDYRSFRFELEDNIIVNVVTDELDEVRGWYEACCLALGRSPANVKLPKPIESVVPRQQAKPSTQVDVRKPYDVSRTHTSASSEATIVNPQLQEQVLSKPTVPASPVIGARTVKVPFIPATAKVSGVAGTPTSTPAPSPAPKYAQVNDLPPVLDIRSAPPRAPAPTVHTEGTAYSAVSRDPAPSFGSVDGMHLSTIAISNEDRPSMDDIDDDDFDMVHYQSSDDQVDEEDFDHEESHSESDAEPNGEYSRGSFASYGRQSPSNQSDLKESKRHSNSKVDASPASKSVQFQAVTLPVIENEDLDASSDEESDVNVSTASNRQAAIVDVTAKMSISIAKTQDNQVSRNFEANTFVPTSMCTPDKCGPGCSANKSFHGRGRIKPSRPPVAQVHKSIASDHPKISRCTPSKCEPGCKANQTHPRPQVSTKSVYMPAKSSVAAVDKSTGTCSIIDHFFEIEMLGRLAGGRAIKSLHRQLRPQCSASLSTRVPKYELERQKSKEPPFEDIIYGQDVNLRHVTFNRPKVLNALNLPMVRNLTPMIQMFEKNPTVSAIIFEGAGEKAFCAGGDIRFLYDNGKDPETRHLSLDFFKEEYRLNYILATMKTPVVSIINGITMGGGVGLSLHGKFVVATEKTVFAMPETAIGFFPDVGASYFLPRLGRKIAEQNKYNPIVPPNQALAGQGLGTFLALSGERIKGPEMLALALATHYIDAKDVNLLKDHLREFEFPEDMPQETRDDMVDESIVEMETTVDEVNEEYLETVEAIFGAKNTDDTIEGIFKRLEENNTEWSNEILGKLKKMSPLSLKVTHRQMREGATKTCAECFQMEYRMANRFMESNDFFEGVRSVIVDKDNNPKWQHASVEDVTEDEVAKFFAPLPEDEELVLYPAAE